MIQENCVYSVKAQYRDSENIRKFIKVFGFGEGKTRFFTMTFSEHITNKLEASKYWNVFLTSIKKRFPSWAFVGVWERQKSGRWHLHLLVNVYNVSNNSLKRFFRYYSGVSSLPVGFTDIKYTYDDSTEDRLVFYLMKYLTKEKRESGIRYVTYSRNWERKVRMPFAFNQGSSRSWRLSCALLNRLFPQSFEFFYDNAGFEQVLQTMDRLKTCTPAAFLLAGDMNFYYSHKFRPFINSKKLYKQWSITRRAFQVEYKKAAYLLMSSAADRPAWFHQWTNKTFLTAAGRSSGDAEYWDKDLKRWVSCSEPESKYTTDFLTFKVAS